MSTSLTEDREKGLGFLEEGWKYTVTGGKRRWRWQGVTWHLTVLATSQSPLTSPGPRCSKSICRGKENYGLGVTGDRMDSQTVAGKVCSSVGEVVEFYVQRVWKSLPNLRQLYSSLVLSLFHSYTHTIYILPSLPHLSSLPKIFKFTIMI